MWCSAAPKKGRIGFTDLTILERCNKGVDGRKKGRGERAKGGGCPSREWDIFYKGGETNKKVIESKGRVLQTTRYHPKGGVFLMDEKTVGILYLGIVRRARLYNRPEKDGGWQWIKNITDFIFFIFCKGGRGGEKDAEIIE